MKRKLPIAAVAVIAAIAVFSYSCKHSKHGDTTTPSVDATTLDSLIERGRFISANKIIDNLVQIDNLSDEDIYIIRFEADKMKRLAAEFNLTDKEVIPYIKKYLPNVTKKQLDTWRASGALECKIIDGERRYFHKAPRNLFRIVPECRQAYEKIEGKEEPEAVDYLKEYIPSVIEKAKISQAAYKDLSSLSASDAAELIQKSSYSEPIGMTIHVLMRVMPDAVPAGEVVRMWLPYPVAANSRQRDIRLLGVFAGYGSDYKPVAEEDYILSPASSVRRSLYYEMKSNGKDTIKFGYDLSFTSYNQYFAYLEDQIRPYDTSSDVYKKYTEERKQHVKFIPQIKRLTDSIIGSESRPYQKVRLIWEWINNNFPWAGARDYSTIPNIPKYVLQHGHGDCGEVSLLFITMARYAGVPAKWQSGWMLHPGNLNIHDWAEVYYEGVGWVPVDQSFGYIEGNDGARFFLSRGMDAFRMIVNEDFGDYALLYPAKIYPHNDEVDFQMGEVEWKAGNVLNGGWRCWMTREFTTPVQ